MIRKLLITLVALAFTLPLRAEESYHKRGNWIGTHGKQASRPSANCYDCHAASVCADCHNSRQELTPDTRNPEDVEKTLIHRGDFRSRHGGEARTDPARCVRCHTTQSCQDCHAREGLDIGATNYPHPAGWMTQSSPRFHGKSALQDIALCASCHERGSATNCITCHSTRATTTSPHPSGWSTGLKQTDPVCANCH